MLRGIRHAPTLALGVGLALGLAAAEDAGAQVTISFEPIESEFPCQDTTTVGVTVDAEAMDLRGASFVFEFDPAVVLPTGVAAGSLLLDDACGHFVSWLNETAIGDSIVVDAAGLGCSVDGPGEYLRLAFTGILPDPMTSPIRCRSVLLRDSLNQTIPYVCEEGILRCLEPVPVETTTWTVIKSVYRGLP